jgi:large subunit ribosomal protein L23
MTSRDIIIRPVITEKSMKGVAGKRYTFKVATNATKIDIARAIAEIFSVKVTKVNTMHVRGRTRVRGRDTGVTPSWKKAIVTLSADSKALEFFEGMM